MKNAFKNRTKSNITVKGLQEQFPDRVLGVKALNKGKVAVIIPNGRIVFDNRHNTRGS